jgi:transposase
MFQMLFANNDAIFQDDNAPVHTDRSVQSWFEEREGELQHLPWPAQSPDLNTIEPFWSVVEARVRNRFPRPASLNQLEDKIQKSGTMVHYYKYVFDIVHRVVFV